MKIGSCIWALDWHHCTKVDDLNWMTYNCLSSNFLGISQIWEAKTAKRMTEL